MGMDIAAIECPEATDIAWNVAGLDIELFHDSYREGSLANWIALNIDARVRGPYGLEIFCRGSSTLNTQEWREELLLKARVWHRRASQLAGHSTVVGFPHQSALRLVDPPGTLAYIEWTSQLLRFAEIVYATGARVVVSR